MVLHSSLLAMPNYDAIAATNVQKTTKNDNQSYASIFRQHNIAAMPNPHRFFQSHHYPSRQAHYLNIL
jgi:hypothetical protein